MRNISQEKLRSISLPLAPEAEQRRVADKLDRIMARVDSVNSRLARIAPLLKRFRQSVLAAATSGRLSENWRGGGTANWTSQPIDSLCMHIGDGPFGSNLKSDDYADSGARVVRLENIGHLRFAGHKRTFVSLEKYAQLSKYTLQPGDLLFSSFVDEEVRVCEFPADIGAPAINKADCFCVRVDPTKCNRRFLMMRLACRSTYEDLKVLVHGATRPRINLRQLRGFQIAVPPMAEQTEIVRRVDSLFAFADRLEARLEAAQAGVEHLTPSLLGKAFRGELVAQDPNDEPASELLRRLAKSRAGAVRRRRERVRQHESVVLTA
jgi:type I restriction enzyme S subunit